MSARGTCDGRHRARKSCPDPECYLKEALSPLEPQIDMTGALMPEDMIGQPTDYPPEDAEVPAGDVVAAQLTPHVGAGNLVATEHDARNQAHLASLKAQAFMDRLAEEPIEFGPGIFRWACARDGGYQRTEYAHELPLCPAGWRWSSAQVTAVGGRGKLHVSAAVVDGSEGANAATGPQSLVLEITGRGGYCTSLDVLLFARPAEVLR